MKREVRIGVVLKHSNPTIGGGAVFEHEILKALINRASSANVEIDTLAVDYKTSSDSISHNPGQPRHYTFAQAIHSTKGRSARLNKIYRLLKRDRDATNNLMSPEEALENRIAAWGYKNKIDLLYSPSPFMPCRKLPYFITVWDLQHRRQGFFPEVSNVGWDWESREKRYNSLLPRAAGVITGTKVGASEIVSFYGVVNKNIHVIPMPVPDDLNLDSSRMDSDLPLSMPKGIDYAMYPAQFWPHKNHVTLLKAWSILNQDPNFKLKLVLMGADHGNREYVEQEINKLSLSGSVILLGYVTRSELLSLYSRAKILVYPSLFGPDNLPPLEAMAARCPVIASRVDGSEEQLSDAACLVDPLSANAFVHAVRKIISDDPYRVRLVRKGLDLVSLRRPEQYASRLIEIFQQFAEVRDCWSRTAEYN